MNIRKIVTFNALRKQFTAEELVLADTLYNATESEREMLVESLAPVRAAKKVPAQPRKIEHCVVCDYTKRAAIHKDLLLSDYHEFQSSKPKSARAASLAEQIKTTGRPLDGSVSQMRCAQEGCGEYADANVHHLRGATGYHEFVAEGKGDVPVIGIANETENVSSVGAIGGS